MNSEVLNKSEKLNIRSKIFEFEDNIKQIQGSIIGDSEVCPLKHSFTDGMYVREIFIPKGTMLTGKIHKHAHPNFLMSGIVDVVTEHNGVERIIAPKAMISEAGTKRALYAVTDLVWITVHLNIDNTKDLEALEKNVIAKDYKEYDKFICKNNNKFISFYNKIIKKLIR